MPVLFLDLVQAVQVGKKQGHANNYGNKCPCQDIKQDKQQQCSKDAVKGRIDQLSRETFDIKVGVNFLDGVCFQLHTILPLMLSYSRRPVRFTGQGKAEVMDTIMKRMP